MLQLLTPGQETQPLEECVQNPKPRTSRKQYARYSVKIRPNLLMHPAATTASRATCYHCRVSSERVTKREMPVLHLPVPRADASPMMVAECQRERDSLNLQRRKGTRTQLLDILAKIGIASLIPKDCSSTVPFSVVSSSSSSPCRT